MALRFVRWLQEPVASAATTWIHVFYCTGIFLFFVASIAVFAVSVQYHWRMCSTEKDVRCWHCVDVSACLSVLLVGYFVGIPLGYHCEETLRRVYAVASLATAAAAAVAVRLVGGKGDGLSKLRPCLIACGFFALVPAAHWLFVSPVGRKAIGGRLVLLMLSGVGAATALLSRYPERWAPDGRFDLVGHSHQLWHVLIFLTIYLYADCMTECLRLIDAGAFCLDESVQTATSAY
jgi:adiponectin receptor